MIKAFDFLTSFKVVLTAARLIYYLAPASQLSDAIGPLLRLLVGSKEVERVVLASLLVIADKNPVRTGVARVQPRAS